jgi:hypothetical protein
MCHRGNKNQTNDYFDSWKLTWFWIIDHLYQRIHGLRAVGRESDVIFFVKPLPLCKSRRGLRSGRGGASPWEPRPRERCCSPRLTWSWPRWPWPWAWSAGAVTMPGGHSLQELIRGALAARSCNRPLRCTRVMPRLMSNTRAPVKVDLATCTVWTFLVRKATSIRYHLDR